MSNSPHYGTPYHQAWHKCGMWATACAVIWWKYWCRWHCCLLREGPFSYDKYLFDEISNIAVTERLISLLRYSIVHRRTLNKSAIIDRIACMIYYGRAAAKSYLSLLPAWQESVEASLTETLLEVIKLVKEGSREEYVTSENMLFPSWENRYVISREISR